MDIYALVARQLRLKRLEAGLTLESLAHSAGISTSFLSCLEANKKKPSLATLASLASALGIKLSELCPDSHPPRDPRANQRELDRFVRMLRTRSPEDIRALNAVVKAFFRKNSGKRSL